MTEEVNQLKRGRVSGKARAPRKSTAVGEISDPTSVLNDSISQKETYVPQAKTTTVDTVLTDEGSERKSPRRPRNEQRNRRRENTRERPVRHHEETPKPTECKCCHTLKRWWHKVLEFLGFRSKCCHKNNENHHRRPSNRRHSRNGRTKAE